MIGRGYAPVVAPSALSLSLKSTQAATVGFPPLPARSWGATTPVCFSVGRETRFCTSCRVAKRFNCRPGRVEDGRATSVTSRRMCVSARGRFC